MKVTRRRRGIVPVLLVALLGGCAGEAPESEAANDRSEAAAVRGGSDQEAVQDTTATTRGALPGLFSLMVGLQTDMARVSRGLWLENFDTIASGAQAVADHPRIPPEEVERVAGVLGSDISRFREFDMEVHDLAVQLADDARAEDLQAVLTKDAELRRACVSCHTTFRDRLREGIAP